MLELRKLLVATAAMMSLWLCHASVAVSDDLAAIKADKRVRIGAVEAPPWYTRDQPGEHWQGLVPEVMTAVFSGTDIRIEYVETQWGTAVEGLRSGQFDLIGAYNATPERRRAIDFSVPMGQLRFSILTLRKPAPDYSTWDSLDLRNLRLGAVEGAGATVALQPLLSHLEWVKVPTSDAMFKLLDDGLADALVTSDIQIAQYLDQHGKGQMSVPAPIRGQPTNIGLRQAPDPTLRKWLDARLAALKADGTLDHIWSKYTASAN